MPFEGRLSPLFLAAFGGSKFPPEHDGDPDDIPTDTGPPPVDPDTDENEPVVDPAYVAPTLIIPTDRQTVWRTDASPGEWGNALIDTPLLGMDYWEVEIGANTPSDAIVAVGVATTALGLAVVPGSTAASLVYRSDGKIVTNNVTETGFPTYKKKDRIGIARSRVDGHVWFSKNCAWLDDNPALGTGWQGILEGTNIRPMVGLLTAGANVQFRFVASKFGCSVPTGFYPIGKTPPLNLTPPVISGLASVGSVLTVTPGEWLQ